VADNHENPEDGDLIRAVRAGDRKAREILVDRYLNSVFAIAMRIIGNPADAEDLTQDTFMRVFERLDQYNADGPFKSWILKIAANLAISHLRSHRREKLFLKTAYATSNEPSATPPATSDNSRELQELLGRLDENERAAIVLFHFQEMSYTEAAEAMNAPINTVRTLLHRGRSRLRELLTRRRSILERNL
jgi:RNA polymerase sigma-70 factor (ECF subfamily)